MSRGGTGRPTSITIPEELAGWLQEAAEESGLEPEEFVRELLTVHQAAALEQGADPPTVVDDEELTVRIEDVRDEFTELLEDVRERVIQVKRETDQKAPLEHDHPELSQRATQATETAKKLESAVEDLEASVEDLRSDLDAGFDNYEDVLEYLVETTDELTSRTDTLARATLSAREQLREVAGDHQRREAVAELQRDANVKDVDVAKCDDCGSSVRISLLTAPECPYCSSTFTEVEAPDGLRGLFSSATLATGTRPALTGALRPEIDEELEESLERSESAATSWGTISEDDA